MLTGQGRNSVWVATEQEMISMIRVNTFLCTPVKDVECNRKGTELNKKQ